ncbi:hypothetical protein B0T16DRAFT_409972 [Cercophora newfieldiana]|uniref:Uncharacterized protein n=1 Tax=Cercophora newfieldiana TaxID=92897 RepID=A0AA40CSB1_9PEZI|nr:hypothetical protein B0T16DRAFT_409972 [Cercophora newfieldiana]
MRRMRCGEEKVAWPASTRCCIAPMRRDFFCALNFAILEPGASADDRTLYPSAESRELISKQRGQGTNRITIGRHLLPSQIRGVSWPGGRSLRAGRCVRKPDWVGQRCPQNLGVKSSRRTTLKKCAPLWLVEGMASWLSCQTTEA